jgi:hypothetical protein
MSVLVGNVGEKYSRMQVFATVDQGNAQTTWLSVTPTQTDVMTPVQRNVGYREFDISIDPSNLKLDPLLPVPTQFTGRITFTGVSLGSAIRKDEIISTNTIAVTITISPKGVGSFAGSFTGNVSESGQDTDSNGNPVMAFTSPYGGPASMVVTPIPTGGFHYSGMVTLQQVAHTDIEDFTATNAPFSFDLPQLNTGKAPTFVITLNEGMLTCTNGTFIGKVFKGDWTYSNPTDQNQSDSGSGTFSLKAQ